MKLQKILSRFLKLHKKEIDLSLDRIVHLCEKLGNPQDKIKAISMLGQMVKTLQFKLVIQF